MSHFSVLVIGPDIEAQLQPYHEYECTGIDDQYVIEVDVTDEVISGFEKYKGDYATIADYAKEDHGAFERDGRFYDKTNPNKKWDWWKIGGWWTGFFLLKAHARGLVGSPGLLTEPAPVGYADQALKGDIDFEQMRNDAGVKARHFWKDTRRITGGLNWEPWDDMRARFPGNIDRAREEFNAQPAIELLKASKKEAYAWNIEDDLTLDEEIYVERARDKACCSFAFVRDGVWTERGSMGWFATVTDGVSAGQWNSTFNAMLDSLPDDTLLTVVDCHI